MITPSEAFGFLRELSQLRWKGDWRKVVWCSATAKSNSVTSELRERQLRAFAGVYEGGLFDDVWIPASAGMTPSSNRFPSQISGF